MQLRDPSAPPQRWALIWGILIVPSLVFALMGGAHALEGDGLGTTPGNAESQRVDPLLSPQSSSSPEGGQSLRPPEDLEENRGDMQASPGEQKDEPTLEGEPSGLEDGQSSAEELSPRREDSTQSQPNADSPFRRARQAREASIYNALSCVNGTYYTLGSGGHVYAVSSADGRPNANPTQIFRFPKGRDDGNGFNGLAIGADGAIAYAFNRNARDDDDAPYQLAIHRWIPGSDPRKVWMGSMPNHNPGVSRSGLVAGGIDPTGPAGIYYFGGFYTYRPQGSSAEKIYFDLLKFHNNSVSRVGYVEIRDRSNQNTSIGNGDIAFNSRGDLFILWNDGEQTTRIVPVLKSDLEAATGGRIEPAGQTRDKRTSSGQYNGLAFDSEGRLFIQYGVNQGAQIWNYAMDPDTGSDITSAVMLNNLSRATDLASCMAPPTLYLVKALAGRDNPGDNFEIKVLGAGQTELGKDTTTGRPTGDVVAAVGTFITRTARTYTLEERALAGTSLDDYTTTITCDAYPTAGGNATPSVVIPTPTVSNSQRRAYELYITAPAKDYDCTITNTPKPPTAAISWQKVSEGNVQPLPGSRWQLARSGGPTISIADNGGQASYSGPDTDPIVGAFRVEDLPYGRYTLTETTHLQDTFLTPPPKPSPFRKPSVAPPSPWGTLRTARFEATSPGTRWAQIMPFFPDRNGG